MATAVSWPVVTVLMFVEFGVLACSALGASRRSRFYLRLGGAILVLLVLALGLAFAIAFNSLPQRALGVVWMALLVAALAAAPVFCYHTVASLGGSSDGNGGGGGWPPSDPSPALPGPSLGGVPLPDADQSRARRRDHNRPRLRGAGGRRRAVEPERPGAPVGPSRR